MIIHRLIFPRIQGLFIQVYMEMQIGIRQYVILAAEKNKNNKKADAQHAWRYKCREKSLEFELAARKVQRAGGVHDTQIVDDPELPEKIWRAAGNNNRHDALAMRDEVMTLVRDACARMPEPRLPKPNPS